MAVHQVNGKAGLCIRIMDAFAECGGPMTKEQCTLAIGSNDLASVGIWINRLVEWCLLERCGEVDEPGRSGRPPELFRVHRRFAR